MAEPSWPRPNSIDRSANLDGITVGARVSVAEGRHFQDFGAGDCGTVTGTNVEAGTCDVLFDKHPEQGSLAVACRHLVREQKHQGSSAVFGFAHSKLTGSVDPLWDAVEQAFAGNTVVDAWPDQSTSKHLSRCQHCGSNFTPDADFCRQCGQKRQSACTHEEIALDSTPEVARSQRGRSQVNSIQKSHDCNLGGYSNDEAAAMAWKAAEALQTATGAAAMAGYWGSAIATLDIEAERRTRGKLRKDAEQSGASDVSTGTSKSVSYHVGADVFAAELEASVSATASASARVFIEVADLRSATKCLSDKLDQEILLRGNVSQDVAALRIKLDGLVEKWFVQDRDSRLDKAIHAPGGELDVIRRTIESLSIQIATLERELQSKAALSQLEKVEERQHKNMQDMLSQWGRLAEERRRVLEKESNAVSHELSNCAPRGLRPDFKVLDEVSRAQAAMQHRIEVLEAGRCADVQRVETLAATQSSAEACSVSLGEVVRVQTTLQQKVDQLQASRQCDLQRLELMAGRDAIADFVQSRIDDLTRAQATFMERMGKFESSMNSERQRIDVVAAGHGRIPDSLSNTMDELRHAQAGLMQRVASLEAGHTTHVQKLESIKSCRLDETPGRLDEITRAQASFLQRFSKIEAERHGDQQRLDALSATRYALPDAVSGQLNGMSQAQATLLARIDALEDSRRQDLQRFDSMNINQADNLRCRLEELASSQLALKKQMDVMQVAANSQAGTNQSRLEDLLQSKASSAASMLSQQWEQRFHGLNAKLDVLARQVDELASCLAKHMEKHSLEVATLSDAENRSQVQMQRIQQQISENAHAQSRLNPDENALIESLKLRVDVTTEGLASESRIREQQVLRMESLIKQVRDEAVAAAAAASRKANSSADRIREALEKQLNAVVASVRGDAERTEMGWREELSRRQEAEVSLRSLRSEVESLRSEAVLREKASHEQKAIGSSPSALDFASKTKQHVQITWEPPASQSKHLDPLDPMVPPSAQSSIVVGTVTTGQDSNQEKDKSAGSHVPNRSVEAPGAARLQQYSAQGSQQLYLAAPSSSYRGGSAWQPHLLNSPLTPRTATSIGSATPSQLASPRQGVNATTVSVLGNSSLDGSRPSFFHNSSPVHVAPTEGGMTDHPLNNSFN
eukprot:TRINITY_DN22150_c0_g1_i1.p1 TRINITY_DN22150_c0_g1~~TRINITY_DN22150_c0_g1_i1.p1  ORF type:complete len:1145 (-),score=212.01 TRINITY_DN22150_c0_g1_i1:192-3626(-)